MQARAGAVAAALTLVPALALAQWDEAALTQRLIDIRELSRFVPDKALAELRVLQPQVASNSAATRAELLVQMSASHMRLGDNDAAVALAQQVIDEGKRLNDDVVLGKGLLAMAYALLTKADVEGAHRISFESEKVAMRTNNAGLRTHATIVAGQVYSEQGKFPQALITLQRALDLSRTIQGDPAMHLAALNALIVLYTQLKEYDKADAMLADLLAETGKLDSPGRMALARTAEYGLAIDSGQYERALQALLRSLELERKLGAKRMIAETLVNLSDTYLKRRDYPRAAQYALESMRLAQINGDESTVATARINLGQAYLALGRIAEGKRYFETGMRRYEQESNKPDLQAVMHEYGEALERAGDMAGAVVAYHRERDLSNELFEKQRQQAVLELQEKYETEKKERQIELLSRENQLKGAEIDNRRLQQRVWWLLALAFAAAAAAIGLMYRKVRNAYAQLEEKNLELKAQSSRDPLTALYNRRHFQEFMRSLQPPAKPNDPDKPDQERRADHRNDVVGALFLLDVDHFKQVNDTYGHAAGDAVLKMIAENLRVALRDTDMIVRWGGEEFLAFLPANPRHGLDDIARRILSGIAAQTIRYQNHDISVNVSVGFSPFPLAPGGTPLPWERAVNLVDMALYMAKSHGRNRAYGINGFANFEQTSMEMIEQDLERAWRAGFVDLSVVLGDAPAQAAA